MIVVVVAVTTVAVVIAPGVDESELPVVDRGLVPVIVVVLV